MNRILLAVVGLSLMIAGCGEDTDSAATGARTVASVAQQTAPAAPRPSSSEVTVSHDGSGATSRFRAGGRSWRACETTVYNTKSGYDLYAIAVSGPLGCAAGAAVMSALSRQVRRRESAGEDCFPGYCRAADPRRTNAAGYRCDATDHGDVSIALSIVCRHGKRHVSAGAADDE